MPHNYPPEIQEDHDESHELRGTSYQKHSQHAPISTTNAFGDGSDSDEQHGNDDEEEANGEEFNAYKDFNNSGVRYVTLLNNGDGTEEFRGADVSESSTLGTSHHNNKTPCSPPPYASTSSPTQQGKDRRSVKFAPAKPSKTVKQKKFRSWRVGVIIAFMSIVMMGLVIFFLIPRQPFLSYETPVTFTGINDSAHFNADKPTNFSLDARLSFSLDGRASYIPARLSNMKVSVRDLASTLNSVEVGKGSLSRRITVGTKSLTPVEMDVHFEYSASAQTDALYQAWFKACGNIERSRVNGTITRPALQLFISITFDVLGSIGTKADSTQQNSVSCPVELLAR